MIRKSRHNHEPANDNFVIELSGDGPQGKVSRATQPQEEASVTAAGAASNGKQAANSVGSQVSYQPSIDYC